MTSATPEIPIGVEYADVISTSVLEMNTNMMLQI